MSKTEDALQETGLEDAAAPSSADGQLPAPRATGNGFAPPTPPEAADSSEVATEPTGNGAQVEADHSDRPRDPQVEHEGGDDLHLGNGRAHADSGDGVELFDVEVADAELAETDLAGAPGDPAATDDDVRAWWAAEPDPELAALAADPAVDPDIHPSVDASSEGRVDGLVDVPGGPAITDDPVDPIRPAAIPGEALRVAPPGTDVLEELRRANIDGPTVDFAPQDDTASSARRPHRLREYDPAPIPIPAKVPRLLGRKPRVRKVTRVVRHVDPWSVFKIAIIANLVLYVIALTSGVLLWNVANATGTVDNVERFFESFGWTEFEFNGGQIYHSAWIAGLFLVIGLTGVAVLAATLFNLITDLVGGMRFTVLEEEVVERRTSPMRRFVVRRPEPEVPAVDHDESGPIIREAVVDDSGAIVRRSR